RASSPSTGGEESPGRNRRRPPRRSALTCSWLCTPAPPQIEVYRSGAVSRSAESASKSAAVTGRRTTRSGRVARLRPHLARARPLTPVPLGHQLAELLRLLVGEAAALALGHELV